MSKKATDGESAVAKELALDAKQANITLQNTLSNMMAKFDTLSKQVTTLQGNVKDNVSATKAVGRVTGPRVEWLEEGEDGEYVSMMKQAQKIQGLTSAHGDLQKGLSQDMHAMADRLESMQSHRLEIATEVESLLLLQSQYVRDKTTAKDDRIAELEAENRALSKKIDDHFTDNNSQLQAMAGLQLRSTELQALAEVAKREKAELEVSLNTTRDMVTMQTENSERLSAQLAEQTAARQMAETELATMTGGAAA